MKKLFFSLFLTVFCLGAFAQTSNDKKVSLENKTTAGTFINEIDKSFGIDLEAFSQFGSFDRPFIHSGLGNPNGVQARDFSRGEFTFGYYQPGTMPMSFSFDFGGEAFGGINRKGKSVKNTWDNIDHKKLLTTTTTTYNAMPVFESSNFSTQVLLGLGNGMATGVILDFNTRAYAPNINHYKKVKYEDHDNGDNNYEENYKNIISAPTFDPSTGITSGTGEANPRGFDFGVTVPFAFSLGDIKNVASVNIDSYITTRNGSYKNSRKDNNIDYKTKGIDARTSLNLGYGVMLPAGREEDYWFTKADLSFIFNSNNSKQDFKIKDSSIDASGDIQTKYKTGVQFGFGVTGGRLFDFSSPSKVISFRLKPTGHFDFNLGRRAAYNPKTTTKGSAGGIELSVTEEKFDEKPLITNINASMSLPMGLKILPENWKIGFILGATPEAGVRSIIRKNRNKDGAKTKSNTNGTTTESYDNITVESGVTARSVAFYFAEEHNIGLTVPFENGAHLDISMNGSNLLLLEAFTIQAFIPLK
ncbi:MAG: hypothetical protein P1P64_00560 [Treponemataceae bacterium]